MRENKIDCIQVHGIKYKEAEKILEGIPHYYTVCGDGESLTKKTEDLSFFGEPRFIQDSKNHEYKKPANGELWLAGGITPSTIRLSIGTEHIDDIISDLKHGFEAVK